MPTRLLVGFVMLCMACSSNGGHNTDDGGSSGPGDFTSVWQASKAQYTFIDSSNPQQFPSQQSSDVPKTTVDPNVGLAVESYLAFDASHLIRYAHYDGESIYYRITEAATASADTYIGKSSNFTLQSGALSEYAGKTSGSLTLTVITTYSVAQFPPSTWPSQVVDYDADANP